MDVDNIRYAVCNFNESAFFVVFEGGETAILKHLEGDRYHRLGWMDEEDIDKAKDWNFRLTDKGYVYCWRGGKQVMLHRIILDLEKGDGKQVDHINRDPSDNRKANLRLCSQSQNMLNRGKWKGTSSKFIGVGWNKGARKWLVHVCIDGKQKHCGLYSDELQAARVSDAARRYYLPEEDQPFIQFNMPNETWRVAAIQERPKHILVEQVDDSLEDDAPEEETPSYTGVSLHKPSGRYVVTLSIDGRLQSHGYYDSPHYAAKVSDAVRRKYRPEKPGDLNFPEEEWVVKEYRQRPKHVVVELADEEEDE